MGYWFLTLCCAALLFDCSGLSDLKLQEEKSYTPHFLKRIGQVKGLYKRGQSRTALLELRKIGDAGGYSSIERAYAQNLKGIIFFSMGDYKRSESSFLAALSNYDYRSFLRTRIHLNLASLYYKKNLYRKTYAYLIKMDSDLLEKKDREQFYELGRIVGKELGRKTLWINSLVGIVGESKSIGDIKFHALFETLRTNYMELPDKKKVSVFEKGKKEYLPLVGYLSYLDAKRRYYEGDKERAIDILDWLKGFYRSEQEMSALIEDFFMRIENFSKMNASAIGIVLPLSGSKANYGKRALYGMDQAIRSNALGKYKIHIADSKGSAAIGSYRVKELAESHFVSTIIGGLFPQEAMGEYLEAKKHGILFISLSQIYLPKDQKDHLLLEVPGSVESQMELLFSKKMLQIFGRRAAIVFPQSQRGEAYVNEFWRKAQSVGVDVTGIQSYKKNKVDYREPIKNLLGLSHSRERKEEHGMLNEIYKLEKKGAIRRVQILKPQIDFDWVFIPAFPKEALQIIPSFSYYDAFGVNIIGESSWRSHSLVKEDYRYINLYFVGDDIGELNDDFTQNFYALYRSKPRIVEILGYDAFHLVSLLLKNIHFESQDELDRHVRSSRRLTGVTGNWNFQDGTWIKKVAPHQLKNKTIKKL